MTKPIPFNKPFVVGQEFDYIYDAIYNRNEIKGAGHYTRLCEQFLEKRLLAPKALLTTSCSTALDLAAMLSNISRGDEFLVPSYTFPTSASCLMHQGAKPIFVDINSESLNQSLKAIEQKMNEKIKAIVIVHYAGICEDMFAIADFAKRNNLILIEDAAQALQSTYNGKNLGTFGDFAALSFHETKNVICGEGGTLIVNKIDSIQRAEILREKGTNRSQFFRGEIDRYSWVDIGGSYLPSDMNAAYLYAQLENIEKITQKRLMLWNAYFLRLSNLNSKGLITLPKIPAGCSHNGHLFYILVENEDKQISVINSLRKKDIHCTFHYFPLHLSEIGRQLGNKKGDYPVTESIAKRIIRLPLFYDMTIEEVERVVEAIEEVIKS